MADTELPQVRFNAEFVRKMSALARLSVPEAELAGMVAHLGRILTLVSQIQEIPAPAGVASFLPAMRMEDLREDLPEATLSRREVSRNAPAHDGAFLVVPKFHGDQA